MDLFPLWSDALGLEAQIRGIDLAIGAHREDVRSSIETLVNDPEARGALVTTHKVAVIEHAPDLFVQLDDWAHLCGEVSCIAKRSTGLHGWAMDPVTSWKAFVDIAGASYFAERPGAEVLCLGAGGSGTAFTSRLLTIDSPPARIHVTNRSPQRLSFLADIHRSIGSTVEVEYHRVRGPDDNDRVLESLPPGSVVANATGMGKDRPGSPISDTTNFPLDAVAWDFNYRGSLEFLHQARRQREQRRLQIADGWRYFLYGWTEHISEVFSLDLSSQQFDELAALSESFRPIDSDSMTS